MFVMKSGARYRISINLLIISNYLAIALYLFNFSDALPVTVFNMAPTSSPGKFSTFCPFTDTNTSPLAIFPSMSAGPPVIYK